jgi:hypothetical protein
MDRDATLRSGVYSRQVNFILDRYQQLALSRFQITLVGSESDGPFTVVDGVHRTVGMALYYIVRAQQPFTKKEVYAGLTGRSFNLHFS